MENSYKECDKQKEGLFMMTTISTPNAPAATVPIPRPRWSTEWCLPPARFRLCLQPAEIAEGRHHRTGGTGDEKRRQSILKAANCGYEDVVKTTCFLAADADFGAFNAVYEKYFTGKPARSCVAGQDAPKERPVRSRGYCRTESLMP